MHMFTTGSVTKKLITFATATLALGVLTAGVVMVARPVTTNAASAQCTTQNQFPETNIMWCGIRTGNSLADQIKEFQTNYDNNSDASSMNSTHVHTDIQAVYNAAGANKTLVDGMNTSNTFSAVSHPDGTVTLASDNRLVGTNMIIAARWNNNGAPGFTHSVNDVYSRSYKTFYYPTSTNVPTIVHIDPSSGLVDFAFWTPCGNWIKVTPVAMPHTLTCDRLDVEQGEKSSTTIGYTFTAFATGSYAPITKYVFDFGDGTTQTFMTSRGHTDTIPHNYALQDAAHTLTASVTVFATNFPNGVTSPACSKPVSIPAKPTPPPAQGGGSTLQCIGLTSNPVKDTTDQFTFTATAQANNTTITGFTFNFGDSTIADQPFSTTSATQTSTPVTFKAGSTHTVQASVTGPLGTFTSSNCQKTVTVGAVLAAETTTSAPTTLVNTGPGGIAGLFGLTTIAGVAFHRFVLRRKFGL